MGPRNAHQAHARDLQVVEEFANKELNYEGADIPGAYYEGDDLDFGGANGFAGELHADQSFSITLDNTGASAVDRVIALNPGCFTSEADLAANGITVAGILRDGQVVPGAAAGAELVGTSGNPNKTINALLEYCRKNPARLIGLNIQSDDPDQFDTIISLTQFSPFKNLGDTFIRLQDFFDPDQFSSKKIEIPLLKTGQDFQFDDQQIALMTILAGRTVKLTLFFGAINNQAKKLNKRAKRFHMANLQALAMQRNAAK